MIGTIWLNWTIVFHEGYSLFFRRPQSICRVALVPRKMDVRCFGLKPKSIAVYCRGLKPPGNYGILESKTLHRAGIQPISFIAGHCTTNFCVYTPLSLAAFTK